MAILINGAPVAPSFGTITPTDFSGVTVHPEFVVKGKQYHNEKGELETGTLTSYGDVGSSDGKPVVVESEWEMDEILANATDEDVGSFYVYKGVTTEKYASGAVYTIEKT